jgi:hypothetical protein
VEVLTEEAWDIAIDSGAVDILCLPFCERLPFFLTRKRLDKLHAAGMCLEVSFAPALQHTTLKRFFAANVSELYRQLRGRFARGLVLVTSGAPSHQLLRAPHDAAAFIAGITGIPRSSVLPCLAQAPLRALQHAATRQSNNGVSVAVQGRLVTPQAAHAPVTSEEQVMAAGASAVREASSSGAASAGQLVQAATAAAVLSSKAAKRKQRRSKKRAAEQVVFGGATRMQIAGAAQEALDAALSGRGGGHAKASAAGVSSVARGAMTLAERAKRARVGM